MADNSTELNRQEGTDKIVVTSAKALVADDILLLNLGGSFRYNHVQLRMFDGAGAEILAGAGTCQLRSMGPGGDSSLDLAFENFGSSIDLTAPIDKQAQRPVEAMRGTLTSETTIVTWQLIFTGYRS